eukprot:scaffold36145_cov69-Phaeocystis_antarctica.AAC.2
MAKQMAGRPLRTVRRRLTRYKARMAMAPSTNQASGSTAYRARPRLRPKRPYGVRPSVARPRGRWLQTAPSSSIGPRRTCSGKRHSLRARRCSGTRRTPAAAPAYQPDRARAG